MNNWIIFTNGRAATWTVERAGWRSEKTIIEDLFMYIF